MSTLEITKEKFITENTNTLDGGNGYAAGPENSSGQWQVYQPCNRLMKRKQGLLKNEH